MLLSVQGSMTFTEENVQNRYKKSLLGAICTYSLGVSLLLQLNETLVELVAAVGVLIAFILLPRRPIVYYDGQPVDNEHGASLLSRPTFSWSPYHQHGAQMPPLLTLHDLPCVPQAARVATLQQSFAADVTQTSLWRSLLRVTLGRMVVQWLLVLLHSVLEFSGRIALYRLLLRLEKQRRRVFGLRRWERL